MFKGVFTLFELSLTPFLSVREFIGLETIGIDLKSKPIGGFLLAV